MFSATSSFVAVISRMLDELSSALEASVSLPSPPLDDSMKTMATASTPYAKKMVETCSGTCFASTPQTIAAATKTASGHTRREGIRPRD
jgi:hypothetical protein